MNNTETIKVLVNGCYGGWDPSDEAIELYNLRKKESEPIFSLFISRHNCTLVQIFEKLGEKFDNSWSKTVIKEIPKKYEKHYDIDEYDGAESILVKHEKYELDAIKIQINKILQSSLTNDEKINELNNLNFD